MLAKGFGNINGALKQMHQGRDQETVYQYLSQCIDSETAENLLDIFNHLFLGKNSDLDDDIRDAIQRILKVEEPEQLQQFLDRCINIIINSWEERNRASQLCPKLLTALSRDSTTGKGSTGKNYRLNRLVKQYRKSHYFLNLEHLNYAMNSTQETNNDLVLSLLHRYPYLFEHYLVNNSCCPEYVQTVKHLKTKQDKSFGINLSQYVTYKIRLANTAHNLDSQSKKRRNIRAIPNPTLLSDRELNKALKQFLGTVDNRFSYRSLAQNFVNQFLFIPTYKDYKESLFQYLNVSLNSTYGQRQLAPKLEQYLIHLLPEHNLDKPSETLALRTSKSLLNFLVVESRENLQHYLFIDILTNLGVTRTMGLLLQLILLSPKLKTNLESHFSILFDHYSSFFQVDVPWLVKALDYLQIAFSLYFGKITIYNPANKDKLTGGEKQI